jgi:GNAT superfamily N-acetyltransferase
MKCQLRLSLPAGLIPEKGNLESVSGADPAALAELMLDSYKGTVDYEGESLEDARIEISNLIEGKYGHFLGEHSFLYWEEGELASATLVTLLEGRPLLAFSMTRSSHKRRGHATALILATADSLAKAGYGCLDLWVTESNKAAINLYRKLGFKNV